MTRDEQTFHDETARAARQLAQQLADVDPALALAAAMKLVATMAIRKGARRGLLGQSIEAAYDARVHELTMRAQQRAYDARPLAEVLPLRRAV